MKGIRESDRDALERRFGLSKRLSARLVVLLARRVAVSEAVLESAAPGSEAETLLLCPEMLEGADGLDSEGLEKLRGSLGLEVFPRLVVGDAEDGLRVIVLEEEALAEASTHALEKRQGADLALRDASAKA